MHKHIWSALQHRCADLRYNCVKWTDEIGSLEARIRLSMERRNHAEAKRLGSEKDNLAQQIHKAKQELFNFEEQIDRVEQGSAR